MNPVVIARIAIAFVAVALFGWGIRTRNDQVRMVAIGLLLLAVLLRFVRPRT
jgi:hypothetical protein